MFLADYTQNQVKSNTFTSVVQLNIYVQNPNPDVTIYWGQNGGKFGKVKENCIAQMLLKRFNGDSPKIP